MSETPEDFVPDQEWLEEHGGGDSGGPGGVVNYPEEFQPEGWVYVEGESTPPEDA